MNINFVNLNYLFVLCEKLIWILSYRPMTTTVYRVKKSKILGKNNKKGSDFSTQSNLEVLQNKLKKN